MSTLFPYPPGTAPTPANQATTSTDLVASLITYISRKWTKAFRARGFNRNSVMDVSDAVATSGYAVKVSVAQTMPSNLLSDGNNRILSDLVPAVADVVITQDRYTAFALTQYVESLVAGQSTLPAMIDGAIAGLLNDYEEDLISTLQANAPNSVGAYNTNCSETTFIDAATTLIQNYMPKETYYALLAPTVGCFDQFMQIDRITYAQVRGGPDEFTLGSPVIAAPERFGQNIAYNGGLWSASTLIQQAPVSGVDFYTSVAWHPSALAVANRLPVPPSPGSGATAENIVDRDSGTVYQALRQWNYQNQSEELLLKFYYGMAPAQSQWSVIIKSN